MWVQTCGSLTNTNMANGRTPLAVLVTAMDHSIFPRTLADPLFGFLLSAGKQSAEKLVIALNGYRIVLMALEGGSDAQGAREWGTMDFLLLDLPGPDLGQLTEARRLADKAGAPLLVITMVADDRLRILALDHGADDCLSRPYSPRELAARLRALARRARGQVDPRIHPTLRLGTMVLDPVTHSVRGPGKTVALTQHEFALLSALVTRPGRILSRESLLSLVQGNCEGAFTRSIDVHIHHLRQKIEADPHRPRFLKTMHGGGYFIVQN